MNEDYQAETMEFEETGVALSDETASAIDADWYGDDFTASKEVSEDTVEEAVEETAEADQQTAETPDDNTAAEAATEPQHTEPAEEEQKEVKEEAADQLFVLKHLDETREVGKDEVIALAQKGLDYDRKTEKLNNKIAAYEEFLDELAGNSNLTKEQFMDSVRARMLIAQENKAGRQISETDALLRVQTERKNKAKLAEEKAVAEQQQKEADAKQKVRDALNRFAVARSDVKAADIPQSVWEDFHKSGDLEASYAKHENSQYKTKISELEKKIEALENNAKNAARSTGSRKTAGNLSADAAFDKLWYNGT